MKCVTRSLLGLLLLVTLLQLAVAMILIHEGQVQRALLLNANTALRERRYSDAIEGYERFLARRPRERLAWFGLGIARYYDQDRAGALCALRTAGSTEGYPSDAVVHAVLEYVRTIDPREMASEPMPVALQAFRPYQEVPLPRTKEGVRYVGDR